MRYILGMIKFALICFMIGDYLLRASLIWISNRDNEYAKRKKLLRLIQKSALKALSILNIHVRVKNPNNYNFLYPPYFFVCNHLSYVDVLILFAYYPSCFVTSKEIQKTPLLGQITSLAGCVFVDRKSRRNLNGEIEEIENVMKDGFNVFIFPEATSTNGESVLRFKRPLFKAALNTSAPIIPLTLNYLGIDNQEICANNRDKLFWYDDMTFLPHFFRLMFSRSINAEICISNIVYPNLFRDISDLALISYDAVFSNFREIQEWRNR